MLGSANRKVLTATSHLDKTLEQDTIKGFLRQEDTLWIAAPPFVSYSNHDNLIRMFGWRIVLRLGLSLQVSDMMKLGKAFSKFYAPKFAMLAGTARNSELGPLYQPFWRRNGRP
jgi:hypothetical protein